MTRRIGSQCLLLGLTGAMIVLFQMSRGAEVQPMLLAGASLVLILFSLLAERIWPLHTRWNRNHGDIGGDIASFALVFVALDGVLKWLSPYLIIALIPSASHALTWPVWTQIVAVSLLIEFGAWLSHWAHHRYPRLWALHAMHHSPTRLYTLNNFRFHPLNHMLNYAVMILPAMALGFSPEALLGYVAITTPVLILQHTNVAFDFGRLNRVLNTNDLHRWHHSTARTEGLKNLGRATVIWDHVFGTFYDPKDRAEPDAVGLFASSRSYPRANRFLAQLFWPCRGTCCQA